MSRGILGGAETNLSSTTGLSPGRAWACPHKRGGSVHFQGCEAHKGGAPSYKGGGGGAAAWVSTSMKPGRPSLHPGFCVFVAMTECPTSPG